MGAISRILPTCLRTGLHSYHGVSFPLPRCSEERVAGAQRLLGNPQPLGVASSSWASFWAFQDLRGESCVRTSGTLLLSITFFLPELQPPRAIQVSVGPHPPLHTLSALHHPRGPWWPSTLACPLPAGIWSLLVPTPLICSLPLIPFLFPRPYRESRDGAWHIPCYIPNTWPIARSIADTQQTFVWFFWVRVPVGSIY